MNKQTYEIVGYALVGLAIAYIFAYCIGFVVVLAVVAATYTKHFGSIKDTLIKYRVEKANTELTNGGSSIKSDKYLILGANTVSPDADVRVVGAMRTASSLPRSLTGNVPPTAEYNLVNLFDSREAADEWASNTPYDNLQHFHKCETNKLSFFDEWNFKLQNLLNPCPYNKWP
jgi:hypothetical protein